jgi:hypothetical protein
MKQAFAMGAVAVILALGTTQGRSDQTNLVQTLEIQLTGLEEGAAVTNGNFAQATMQTEALNTGRVIAALGAATQNTFSRAAKITVTTPLPDGAPSFAVTDGTTSVDVTGFFIYQQLGDSVDTWQLNLKTGRGSSTVYSLRQFILEDYSRPGYPALTLFFNVTGLAVDSTMTRTVFSAGDGLNATVTGLGELKGNALLLQGNIALVGDTLVVVPGGGSAGD